MQNAGSSLVAKKEKGELGMKKGQSGLGREEEFVQYLGRG